MLIKNAEELQGYSLEELIKGIADSGARVVAAGSAIGDMALHFIEKYGMMALRIPSKFDLRRFCRCVPAEAHQQLSVDRVCHMMALAIGTGPLVLRVLQICDGNLSKRIR